MKHKKLFYALILVVFTFLSTGLIGNFSVYTTKKILKEDASQKLNLKCQNTCLEFNNVIDSIEQTVDTISAAALFHMVDFERFKSDDAYVDAYTDSLIKLILHAAENTNGAMSVYIRYNPEITSPVSGAFYVLDKDSQEFVETQVTDFRTASKRETNWFYIPVENGKPTWLEPYSNESIGYQMISYVVPYYINGENVGIIGMDIDYEYLKKLASNIKIYDTGHAFLLNKEGQVMTHPDYILYETFPNPDLIEGIKKLTPNSETSSWYEYTTDTDTISCSLVNNGMVLAISVPNEEIYRDSKKLTKILIIICILTLIGISILSTIIITRIFRLSEIDELTGIYNRKYFINTYNEWETDKLKNYSLFIFDIDKFKQINDTYGHNSGDLAIQFVAQTAKNILGKSAILARWGGDEFIGLILTRHAEDLLELLRSEIEKSDSELYGKMTISIGLADTHANKDLPTVTDAADKALYTSKTNGRNRLTIQKGQR